MVIRLFYLLGTGKIIGLVMNTKWNVMCAAKNRESLKNGRLLIRKITYLNKKHHVLLASQNEDQVKEGGNDNFEKIMF